MPIYTIKAKNAHPITSKIPMLLWIEGLDREFHDEALRVEGKSFKELTREDFPENKESALISLLVCYSNQEPYELIAKDQEILKSGNEAILIISAALGYKDIISYFKNQEPDVFNSIFNEDKSIIYDYVFSSGNLETILWFKKEYPEDFDDNTIENKFIFACLSGNLELVNWLKEQVSSELFMKIIQSDNYGAFVRAAMSDNLAMLKWLKKQAPEITSGIISLNYTTLLKNAVLSGNVAILKWLNKQVLGNEAIIVSYEPLIEAFRCKDEEVLHWFLSQSIYFDYAESHTREYGEEVNAFIQNTLQELGHASEVALANNPNEVFDIADEDKAHLCFFIMRNLIRRNDRAQDDALRFLLNIPSVKALAHQAVGQSRVPNALLRLAMDVNNTVASELLLNIDAVRLIAQQNNFYRTQARRGVNLEQLAQDRESSMTALTTGEAKKLESAIAHYQPMLKSAGPSLVVEGFRDELIHRYEKNPASIIDSQGKTIILPLDYQDLQALKLNEADYDKALIAYYKNDDHTALRYLSKPNPWMHPEAAFVNVDSADRTRRWSSFDEYLPLIAMFYLAATDNQVEATEGHTQETKLSHFINELAFIGRAHNWDRTRIRDDGRGEEYDDLQADRPSCYSGVKRRLFQSVVGHPLFDVLDETKIENEIRQFAVEHFKAILTEENKAEVKKVIDECFGLEGVCSLDNVEALRMFDISKEKQEQFIDYLGEKYGAQFKEDKEFVAQVNKALFLNPEDKDAYKAYHVLKLFDLTNFYDFLDPSFQINKEEAASMISAQHSASVRFFPNNPQDIQPQEKEEQESQLKRGTGKT